MSIDVCGGRLHVERFLVNSAGIDADYLTDSVSFRFRVGEMDNEHENYRYICEGDSIEVVTLRDVDMTGIRKAIAAKKYSLKDLKKDNKITP